MFNALSWHSNSFALEKKLMSLAHPTTLMVVLSLYQNWEVVNHFRFTPMLNMMSRSKTAISTHLSLKPSKQPKSRMRKLHKGSKEIDVSTFTLRRRLPLRISFSLVKIRIGWAILTSHIIQVSIATLKSLLGTTKISSGTMTNIPAILKMLLMAFTSSTITVS